MFGIRHLERKTQPLAPLGVFLLRLWRNFLGAFAFLIFSLGIGTLGYHFIGDVPWIDALLNASMILTGMGPVDKMETTGGKLFATFYALYSGVAFLTMVAVDAFDRGTHRWHRSAPHRFGERARRTGCAAGHRRALGRVARPRRTEGADHHERASATLLASIGARGRTREGECGAAIDGRMPGGAFGVFREAGAGVDSVEPSTHFF